MKKKSNKTVIFTLTIDTNLMFSTKKLMKTMLNLNLQSLKQER